MANDKLKELEQRLFELEKAFDKNLIDFETYIRQRSLLIHKKEIVSTKSKKKLDRIMTCRDLLIGNIVNKL